MIRNFIFVLFLSPIFSDIKAQDTTGYIMDTVKSYLEWQCDNHHGIVPLKEGYVETVGNKLVTGFFIINMDSLQDLDIDYELMRQTLHNTLRSIFFFDTKNFPTSTFVLDYAEPAGKNEFLITGDLEIKGIVQCIQFKSKVTFDNNGFSAESEKFYINRTYWGITIYSKSESHEDDNVIISDEVYFKVHLKGKRAIQ